MQIIDLERSYKVSELKEMLLANFQMLMYEVGLKGEEILQSLSPEDQAILKEAKELAEAPYYLAANPAALDYTKQEEAAERDTHINFVLEMQKKINQSIFNKYPNFYKTNIAIQCIIKNK